MLKSLIIGIDLSFNSTGITIAYLENNEGKTIEFDRLVFQTTPHPIKNINQSTYNLPSNIHVKDLIVEETEDNYSEDQSLITLKAMVCTKRIMGIIIQSVKEYSPNEIYFNIEGFIMPSMTGGLQLRVLGGLIMLQGMLRAELIKFHIANPQIPIFKIFITSPSELKLFFTGKGGNSTTKEVMLECFINDFEGRKLLPDTESLAKVNDVIDSFALMLNCFWRLHTKEKRKLSASVLKKAKKKKSSKVKTKTDIYLMSKPIEI